MRIDGLETVSRQQILNKIEDVFSQKKFLVFSVKNYFLFPAKKFEASLVQNFPKMLKVKIQKIYPENLAIQVLEREAVGIWCLATRLARQDLAKRDGQCFYFDKEGVIFESAPTSFGSLIPLILDERPVEPRLGATILGKKEAQIFKAMYGIVSRNFSFSIRALRLTERGEFEIVTSEDWKIFLDKKASADGQLSNLKYLLEEKIKNRRHELEYVDLRLGSKVYYKYKGESP